MVSQKVTNSDLVVGGQHKLCQYTCKWDDYFLSKELIKKVIREGSGKALFGNLNVMSLKKHTLN